jgi:hypothetical protein
MRIHKDCGTAIPLCVLAFTLSPVACLEGQQRAGASPKLEAYVVPFSHLDLFWAGAREERLARGNRIIAKALQIAKQHPEFHFLLESDNFVANYVESHLRTGDGGIETTGQGGPVRFEIETITWPPLER